MTGCEWAVGLGFTCYWLCNGSAWDGGWLSLPLLCFFPSLPPSLKDNQPTTEKLGWDKGEERLDSFLVAEAGSLQRLPTCGMAAVQKLTRVTAVISGSVWRSWPLLPHFSHRGKRKGRPTERKVPRTTKFKKMDKSTCVSIALSWAC